MCRKEPGGMGYMYQKTDDKVNQCKKYCAVVVPVTESSLVDNIVSTNLEHGSFETYLRRCFCFFCLFVFWWGGASHMHDFGAAKC